MCEGGQTLIRYGRRSRVGRPSPSPLPERRSLGRSSRRWPDVRMCLVCEQVRNVRGKVSGTTAEGAA